MKKISISLVLYENSQDEIKELLTCLDIVSDMVHIEVIDNSKTDRLRSLCTGSNISYTFNNKNIGFGAAHNIAIRKSIKNKIPYHLVLNPDVKLKGAVIQTLYHFMEQHPDIGNVMPKILYHNGTLQNLCKLLPRPQNLFLRRFLPKTKLSNRINRTYELDFYQYDQVIDVPNLSGCFMFLRTSVLEKVGGFDERFFMYMEDIDLNRRIHQLSRTVCYPFAEVLHGFKKESYRNPVLLKLHIQSAIKYFNKWGWLYDNKRELINKATLHLLEKYPVLGQRQNSVVP